MSLLAILAGVYCHRNWRTIFPEDPPGTGRHHHPAPTPMTGLIPVFVALAAFVHLGESWWVISGIAIASLTGFVDDRGKTTGHEMPWQLKGILVGIGTAMVLVEVTDRFVTPEARVLVFLWLFAMTNAVNFMDNTNGSAAALGALGLLLASGGEGAAAYAAFAFVGFLPANWPRASVFLGDSGSLGLGLLLGWATLNLHDQVFHWAMLAPVAMFALDFVQVILARLVIGVPPWLGDRRHITHIVMNLGLPEPFVAPVLVTFGVGTYLAYGEWA